MTIRVPDHVAVIRLAIDELEVELSRVVALNTVPAELREKLRARMVELKRKAAALGA